MRPVFFCLMLVAASGCGNNIGDNCSNNVDCDPGGTRFCDTSAPNGYCTIDGCDVNTCPGEAVCIRFLTPVLDEPCTFDNAHPNTQADCPHLDDICVCDKSDQTGRCPAPTAAPDGTPGFNGHCAPASTERRWCQYGCTNNSDCRAGYECRETGTLGAEPVPTFDNPLGQPVAFCAPMG